MQGKRSVQMPLALGQWQPARNGQTQGKHTMAKQNTNRTTPQPAAQSAPVVATSAQSAAPAAHTTPAPLGLPGCTLLPLAALATSHGAAIYAAATLYPQGPLGAAALGAPASYLQGACSYLACAGLGYNRKAPKKAGAAGVWYNPAQGVLYSAHGAAMPYGVPGGNNGATPANTAALWAQCVQAVQAYHAAQGGTLPQWATPAQPAA